jgi:3-oxoacyl-[acyl-carrier protein] reductase
MIDIGTCPRSLKIIACIEDPAAIDKVLTHRHTNAIATRRRARRPKKALPGQTPTIINISLQARIVGKEGQAAYVASKGGIIGFAQLLASTFRSRGLTVNTVVPGLVRTDMVKDLAPEMYEHFLEGTPLRRMGEAEEIAAVVAFLATTGCRYLNSTALKVDGGFHR